MTLVTVVLPVAPYHEGVLDRALASVAAQTLPCDTVVVRDAEARGAGWARNTGLAQVQTPYLIFLDADDTIAPDFAERCLAVRRRHHYVYTDYVNSDGRRFDTPDCAWKWEGDTAWHCVTALIPTAFVRAVGGFDEALPYGEDTDFYMKLTRAGYCGQRVSEPLFTYHRDGQRGRPATQQAANRAFIKLMVDRYGGKPMSCCGGDNPPIPSTPANEPFEGAQLAQALWAGNRIVRGRVTGRTYARVSYPAQLWVDSRDLDAMRAEFQRVAPLADDPLDMSQVNVDRDDAEAFEELALEVTGGQRPPKPETSDTPPPAKRNTRRAASKAKKAADGQASKGGSQRG